MQVTQLPLTGASLEEPLDFERPGMPALDSVHDAVAFTPVPGGRTYTVLRTTELDVYEPRHARVTRLLQHGIPSPAALVQALRAARAAAGDTFAGTARKAAKLSIGTGPMESFEDVRDLIGTLVADSAMVRHVPRIGTTATSRRVKEEQRNVHAVGFLYAASREADNDFHLIVGRDTTVFPETYMTVEVSGLPTGRSPALQLIKGARDSFQTFFGNQLPQLGYDFYDPPIPVEVEGSLFFDMSHAAGPHPGPPSLKSRMPTIWEVHPVTAITLG